MSPDKKKYVITAIILGVIAMSSGVLIGLTNLVTKGPISEYEAKQINKGIEEIFSGHDNIYCSKDENKDKDIEKDENNNKYINHVYYVYDGTNENDSDNAFVGYAFKAEGSNNYGKIALIIGFNSSNNYENIYVIKNEQSFATTLNEEYVEKVKKGDRNIEDVSCGATYGAKTIRDMIKAADYVMNNIIIKY